MTKKTIGIYTDNDWTGAEALADEFRASGDTAVRIRNGAMFTPGQREEFDAVYVHGDFPVVRAAYPDAKNVGDPKQAAKAEEAPKARKAPK